MAGVSKCQSRFLIKSMNTDPIVAEVREARERLAAKFNYNVAAIVRDAQKRQKQSNLKVVSFQPRRGTWPPTVLPSVSTTAVLASSASRKMRACRAVV